MCANFPLYLLTVQLNMDEMTHGFDATSRHPVGEEWQNVATTDPAWARYLAGRLKVRPKQPRSKGFGVQMEAEMQSGRSLTAFVGECFGYNFDDAIVG